ncbi:ankyrin repeat domain protein [Ectocarpus siliculosus]|uniref:Ankyrin repeat domain protein n=1 Tax=Ectocarpus siliculosus TaxID=2880 RepID=D7G0W2_ECTSI|nr:ankyrin repeat domain protein [Ectocarpus siliculosus]|eukprot:CBJ26706.1 ankyrin repeat domain protein [Ectocarpus siliculosus]
MAAGADVNVRDGSNGYSPLDCSVRSDGMDLTRQVLQRGAIATESSSDGCTALHWAGWNMNASAIDLLVGAGANLEAKIAADAEATPLHLAARQAGNAAVIEALARHGADVHAQETPSGNTPLHVAAQNCTTESSWETVDALLKAGADETRLDCQGQTPLDVLEARIAAGDLMGASVNEAERTRSVLVNAPKDRAQRAWSRRSFFVMCRAHPDRVRLTVVDDTTTSPRAKKTMAAAATAVGSGRRGANRDSADNFQRAMRSLIRLKEDGLFRKIVAFL